MITVATPIMTTFYQYSYTHRNILAATWVRSKIGAHREKVPGIWGYRLLDTDPVNDNVRCRVLKESGGRYGLYGATKKERPLDVDQIKSRSKGGKNWYGNLQVLSPKCNR